MFFDTLCRRLRFLDKVNLYRENSLYSDTWKNVPSLLVRGSHFQKDMIYGRHRMDDIIERPLDFWLKKSCTGQLIHMALLKNLALLGLCFKGGKSFIYKPVHSPEAKDWHHIDTHLWAMKKYRFNFLQLFGRNFPQTVQQMKTEQTFMNKAHSSASSYCISTTFTTIAVTKGWVWPWARYKHSARDFLP